MLSSLLPQEIIDHIYKFTDLDTIQKQQPNNQYLIDYFKDPYKEQHKYIYEKHISITDKSVNENITLKDGIYQKLHTVSSNIIIEGNILKIPINEGCFNLLELKIYNPDKRSFNEIFNYIKFEIHRRCIYSLYDEEQINISNELFKIGKIRYNNNYTIIPLPFLLKKNYIKAAYYHGVNLVLRSNINEIINFKPEIYGYTYKDQERYIKFNQNILQWNYNYLQLTTILLSIIVDTTNIKYIILKLDKYEIKYDIKKLNVYNKTLGYNFNYPTIIFDKNFFTKKESTINFTRIHEYSIEFLDYYNNEIKYDIKEYKLISINSNILIKFGNMYGVRYSL